MSTSGEERERERERERTAERREIAAFHKQKILPFLYLPVALLDNLFCVRDPCMLVVVVMLVWGVCND